ncbi:MAG: hypothetical protein ACM3VV_08280, partial [Deltaproteobacteria bacterium]
MYSLKNYLITLLSTKNIESTVDSNLDYITRKILSYIAVYPSSSTNDCYMYLNNNYQTISYENVDVHIDNLIDLGLIQKVKNIDNKNNGKSKEEDDNALITEKSNQDKYLTYYSISSAGIFYLFTTDPEITDIELILKN